MNGDSKSTRRHFLRGWLWTIGLLVLAVPPIWFFGIRPFRAKWSLLPLRPVDWTMKPLSSAKIEERRLPDGRVELHIEHDLLVGITPAMLVWWWRNIDGEIELKGQTYRRYLIWHPIDHIHFEVLTRLSDGSVGVGSTFHLVEALGADMRNLVDVALQVIKLDETGAAAQFRALGKTMLEIRGQFVPRPEGTQFISTMTLGTTGWLGSLGVSSFLIERFFPPERRKAWLRHSVEEIGNLQVFLPELYRRHARG